MCICNSDGTTGVTASPPREVLPTWVVPSHYAVSLTPNLGGDFKYSGVVEIDVDVKETTKTITVNANEIEVSKASIVVRNLKTESTEEAVSITYDKALERVSFEFTNDIPAGAKATVTAEFTGTHNDQLAGFYRSTYTDSEGNKKVLVVTQFEPTDCRRAFPSFDEPALKATFDITLNVEPELTALSNMEEISSTVIEVGGKSLKSVKFARTPIMSTYLVACAVGDFEYIEQVAHPKLPADAKPITCRVYTLKGDVEQGRFGLDVCVRTLEFFSEYFDIAYPLPKCDLIAIPDFGAGAMENWGLITYRTVYLLFDPVKSGASAKERIAYVVGHELAHQWFGNLVTMSWWNALWLNEGFATFVGWLAVDHLFPEWKIWTSFVTGDFAQAHRLDGLRSSHPIDVDVRAAADVNEIFDAISYSKGASVIRMLNTFLGGSKFMNGVRTYLKEFQYKNAETADLWRHLSASSGVDIATMMHQWTRETGHPLVTVVSESYDAEATALNITFRQNRFLSSGAPEPEEDKVVWWVPLNIVTHLSPSTTSGHVLTKREETIVVPFDESPNAYWALNYGATGFYRTKLLEEQVHKISKVLQNTPADKLDDVMPATDRIQFLSDAFALTTSGLGSAATALEVMMALKNEENYMALGKIHELLNQIKSVWVNEPKPVRDGLDALGRLIFSSKAAAMGFEFSANDDQITTLKRALVISASSNFGDKTTQSVLSEKFSKFIAGDKDALSPNIRAAAYKAVMVTASSDEEAEQQFEKLLTLYKDASLPDDQRLFVLTRLGSGSSKALASRVLDIALDFDLVRPQDIFYPLRGLIDSPLVKEYIPLLWEWMQRNWDVLHKQFSPTISLLGNVVAVCTVKGIGEEHASAFEAWLAGEGLADDAKATRLEQVKGFRRVSEQTLETIRSNTRWVEREREAVAVWVSKTFPSE